MSFFPKVLIVGTIGVYLCLPFGVLITIDYRWKNAMKRSIAPMFYIATFSFIGVSIKRSNEKSTIYR